MRNPHLKAVLDNVVALQLKEAIAPLRMLFEKSRAETRRNAATALRALGEDVAVPEILGPVQFRFVSDGKPYSLWSVSVNFHEPTSLLEEALPSVGAPPTDQDGVLSVPWDDYEPWAAKHARISFFASTVRYQDGAEPDPRAALFEIDCARPVARVRSRRSRPSQRVTLEIARGRDASPIARRSMQIRLLQVRTAPKQPSERWGPQAQWEVPIGPRMTTSVQPGRYVAMVTVPGHEPWKLDSFEVGAKPVSVPVKLHAGTDVKYRFVDREGERLNLWPKFTRDGKPTKGHPEPDGNGMVFRGLPPGRYTLRVDSTETSRGRNDPDEPVLQLAGPRHNGVKVAFQIARQPPQELDLGRIVVPLKAN